MFSKNFIINFFFRAMPGATKKFAKKFCDWQLCHKSKVFFPHKNAKKIPKLFTFPNVISEEYVNIPSYFKNYCGEGLQNKTPIGLNLKQYAC